MTKRRDKRGEDEAEAFSPPPIAAPKGGAKLPAAKKEEVDDPQARFAAWSAANMTSLEKKVWNFLGKDENPWRFKPQVVVGPYTLDFYSTTKFLCIEADGPSHIKTVAEDTRRDEYLRKKHGIITLRLTRGDFVRHSRVKLYNLIEEFSSPKHALTEPERGKK